jgi:spermidine synthase
LRLATLLVLFFCSGFCGLTFQVLWLRLLSLVFGVTAFAASTVLAAFMAGLALGSVLASHVLSRVGRPLRVFAIAEIMIGLSALATPLALDGAAALYQEIYPASGESLALLTAARLAVGFVVLLVPTVLMGMTLPVLSASSLVRGSSLGARISALYAINTAGGVTGAVLTGFYLIGAIGIQRSFLLGAIINVAVGVVALLLDRADPPEVDDSALPSHGAAPSNSTRSAPSVTSIGVVVLLSGLAALALEVLWFRMLVQYLAATTYAFTTMLTMVLAGIAVGGAIAARALRRSRDWTGILVITQLITAVAVVGSAVFLAWSYAAGWKTSGDWQASAVAILPTAILMGIGFPLALHLAVPSVAAARSTAVARRVGRLYSLNVCGAIAGSLLGGFVLLPLLGTRRAIIAMAAVYGASALVLVMRHPRRGRLLAAIGVTTIIFVLLAGRMPDPFAAAHVRRYGPGMREYWREEGVQTAVSVHVSEFRRTLYLDGLHQANDTPEMVRLHRIIGHLPMVLHPAPRSALVIGLGGGATAGAVSQHTGAHVQIVELSDSVRKAASFFSHVNYDVMNQPNVRLRVDDGRNFLMLAGEKFDVVTADIIQPTHAGAGNLYSREYFQLVRDALEADGLALQWIGHRPLAQYTLIMRTFLEVFPHATLWFDGNLMVGSMQPLALSPRMLTDKRSHPITAAALDDIGLSSFDTLASWYTAGPNEMRRFAGSGAILTDDRPLLEYHRSLPHDDRPLDLTGLSGDVRALVR